MRKLLLFFISVLLLSSPAMADNGFVSVRSAHGVNATADRLEKILEAKGMTVFTRINHAEAAKSVGKKLRPTELVIFGNPKVGTPFMQCGQSAGIDLPQKALIWEDSSGQVWLSYNHPQYLAKRHGIKGCSAVIEKIETALDNFSKAATKR